jgi:cell division protein FtsQ
MLDELYELATYISNDAFLKAQIEQIYIERNKEITLIPKVGDQEIIFGKAEDIKKKFDKLVLFYTKGINPNNLNLYKTINLKFDNQIVCKKNQ